MARNGVMRKPLVVSVLSALVLTLSAVAGYRNLTAPRFAEVLAVREVNEARTPRQRCADAPAASTEPGNGAAACATPADGAPSETAFDVRYRLAGKEDRIRLPYDPGKQIPVKDGKLVLEPPAK